jgi:hypothetical protein
VAAFFLPLEGKQIWITLVACAPLILLAPVAMSYVYAKSL